MKRNHPKDEPQAKTIQVWSYPQAKSAFAYIASVLRSLREHRLEAQQHQLAARRLADQPGRPDRKAIIAHQEELQQARLAEDRFQEALEELQNLDIYCLDPVGGLALIPFVQEEQLAWFIFDLFAEDPVQFWRYHSDPLEKRRPLKEIQQGSADLNLVV